MTGERRFGWPVVLSLLLAFALTILPLPEAMRPFRPDWVALTLLYWAMNLPRRIGIGVAWGCGLILDTLKGALLGQHALALCVASYLTLKIHQQVRVFPIGQQTLTVLVIVAVYHFLLFWVDGAAGGDTHWPERFAPLISNAMLWPVTVIAIDAMRRRAQTA